MENNTLFITVVIYNSTISDSKSCQSLKKICNHDIKIIIVDNSTKRNSNKFECSKEGWTYISMLGNAGLSKAYNRVLDSLTQYNGLIIWFDDDTNIKQEYFDELIQATINHPECDIFVPLIIGQDGRIWSPNKAGFLKNTLLKSKNDKIDDINFNAINSCSAVRLSVYKKYRYDERIFLDQVDHKFYYDQRKLGKKFLKINVEIEQCFSQMDSQLDMDMLWKRLQIRFKDITTYGIIIGGLKYRLLAFIKCCGISFQLSRKTKSFRFFFQSMKLSIKLFLVDFVL